MDFQLDKALNVFPSERQLNWQKLEFYGFIHFSINTFTGREWGYGNESPSLFNPTSLDTDQWVKALKSAGMKGIILTVKHHDGFCLWPSRHTDYSVKNSPWKDGKGDILADFSHSCRKEGIKLGIYLSPWDRHDSRYGTEEYNGYFKAQLREVLTEYGEVFEVWFDGACGEGKNGIKQKYDWPGYYSLIRELQPNAVISVMGPDIRWCGNESGYCRPSEWSVVPDSLFDTEDIADKSQQVDDGKFIKALNQMDTDLGSRKVISRSEKLIWYPSEVNTSIRPGWFYHKNQDRKIKSLKELFNLYCNSTGGNNSLLLNVPPDNHGLIAPGDVRRLKELGECIDSFNSGRIPVSSTKRTAFLLDGQDDSFLETDCTEPILSFPLDMHQNVNTFIIEEYIERGQRIENFEVDVKRGKNWKTVYRGTTVGYRKICRFRSYRTTEIRLRITSSRANPILRNVRLTHYDTVGRYDFYGSIKRTLSMLGNRIYIFYMEKIK